VRYRARAPLRIDFGGGWTDVPLYADREGGAVLNAAITQYAHGYIARPEPDGAGVLRALRGDRSHLTYSLDLPSGSGLGASAAQTVLWVALVRSSIANTAERRDVAASACRVAEALGILGGKQDEYASALGGITYFTFGETVRDERLELDSHIVEALHRRLILVYSGQKRLSSAIHESVWSRYRSGEPGVVSALSTLKNVAGSMRDALLKGDLDAFGDLIGENWAQQKMLHASITNERVEDMIDYACAHGAAAAKACGAGGGGCLLLYARQDESDRLRSALAKRQVRIVDFHFDTYGVYLKKG
jgi:D-glycero-alpha-D-manno-heptose-7-phosphate kinase